MRVFILGVVVAWVVGAGAGAAGGTGGTAAALDDGACRGACFARKSKGYQRCRAVPPRDREARERCFRSADAALERCLSGCPK